MEKKDEEFLLKVFHVIKDNQKNVVYLREFFQLLMASGLRKDDPRLQKFFERALFLQTATDDNSGDEEPQLTEEQFLDCVRENHVVISRALKEDFIIPEFDNFTRIICDIFDKCRLNENGEVASYIPQLARFDRNLWGMSICTVDGQRFSTGDSQVPFCLQSLCQPLIYALVLNELHTDEVHRYVGREPSGRSFNELSLDQSKKPHNPLINAGALAVIALMKNNATVSDRYDYMLKECQKMAGHQYISFSNPTFLSERETADRNFAIGHYLRENKVFPSDTKLADTLDLYFQSCSIESNCDSVAVIAATLANGGICPLTDERVLSGEAIRNTLSLMHSCGMLDYSGQFAFKVGIPAKSAVSGAIMVVVPNILGICVWSPALDALSNSVRGIQFCEELVKVFKFHNYDNLKSTQSKLDPRLRQLDFRASLISNALFCAGNGDITALKRIIGQGLSSYEAVDYDGRTALHVAAAEGQLEVVEFLIEKCGLPPECVLARDRFGFTPLDEAIRFSHHEVQDYMERMMGETKPKLDDEKEID